MHYNYKAVTMDKKKMAEYLETIPKPVPDDTGGQERLKIFLVTAKRSSRIGLLLIGLPALLISLFIIQTLLHIKVGFIRWLGENASSLPMMARAVLIFVFLIGFPMIAMILNLLSLSHFQYDRLRREFRITFRIRWWNIVIALAGGALAAFYILHLLADTLLGGG